MRNVVYTLLAIVGLFLTLGESSNAFTNIIGIVILTAVCWKVGLLNIKDYDGER